MNSLMPAEILVIVQNDHDTLTRFCNGAPKCLSKMSASMCVFNDCEFGKQCSSGVRQALQNLLSASATHFQFEHAEMKPYVSREHFELHCDEHANLTQVLVSAMTHVARSANCAEAIGCINEFSKALVRHTETLDVEYLGQIARATGLRESRGDRPKTSGTACVAVDRPRGAIKISFDELLSYIGCSTGLLLVSDAI